MIIVYFCTLVTILKKSPRHASRRVHTLFQASITTSTIALRCWKYCCTSFSNLILSESFTHVKQQNYRCIVEHNNYRNRLIENIKFYLIFYSRIRN
jgi:hypothetical protein